MVDKTIQELQALRQRLENDMFRAKVNNVALSRNDVLVKNHEKVIRDIREVTKKTQG